MRSTVYAQDQRGSTLGSAVKLSEMLAAVRSLFLLDVLHLSDRFPSLHFSLIKPDHKLTGVGISLVAVTPQRLL